MRRSDIPIAEIFQQYTDGVPIKEIAIKHKVHYETIRRIIRKEQHRQVNEKWRKNNPEKLIKKHEPIIKCPIREYTEASDMMLVQDIDKGRKPKEMAAIYNRDIKDLRKHIKWLLESGEADRLRRKVKAQHENSTIKGSGVGLL